MKKHPVYVINDEKVIFYVLMGLPGKTIKLNFVMPILIWNGLGQIITGMFLLQKKINEY